MMMMMVMMMNIITITITITITIIIIIRRGAGAGGLERFFWCPPILSKFGETYLPLLHGPIMGGGGPWGDVSQSVCYPRWLK